MFTEDELDKSQFQNQRYNNNQSGQQNYDRGQNYGGNRYINGGGNSGYNNSGQNYGNGGNNGYRNYNRSGDSGNGGYRKNNFYRRSNDEDQGETTLYKPFVATGNQNAPDSVVDRIIAMVKELEQFGFTLRTGGLNGIDDAVEKVSKKPELVLPWNNFNGKQSKNYFNTRQSFDIAKMFHPAFDGLSEKVRPFLAKNARMVLGKNLDSAAMFIICWTDDGAELRHEVTARTGNTGHVIAIASGRKIPVFNFHKPDAEMRLRNFLELTSNGQAPSNTTNQQNSNNIDNFGF